MPRIRSIKPEFFVDEDVSELSFAARLLYIGLWTLADRAGRLEDRPKRIKVQTLPYDAINAEKLLAELASHPETYIIRYTADDGRKYIQIRTFEDHQRPNTREAESIIPEPTEHDLSHARTCKHVKDSGERKGREGEREGKGYPPSDDDETFSSWWSRYPKKVKRKDAERAFNKLTKAAKVAASGPGYDAWLHKWEVDGTEKKYIPNPATWLNAEQWKDEGVKPERRQRKPGEVDMYVGAGDDHCPYPDPTK